MIEMGIVDKRWPLTRATIARRLGRPSGVRKPATAMAVYAGLLAS